MRKTGWILGAATAAGLLTGCVERRYVITSDPPGALVLRNGQPLGFTPVDDHFVYYGNYHFTLIKDGYTTLQVDQKIPTPWYQYLGLDFISEALVPTHIEDVRRFNYHLEPVQAVNINDLLQHGGSLRNEGRSIGPPRAVPPPPPQITPPPPAPPWTALPPPGPVTP
ncbi:MAG: PEGA domain-containing protein [Planctomycetes bacterium]|nr:PEGA domain-containing protein [Planctomycetota bacterium]